MDEEWYSTSKEDWELVNRPELIDQVDDEICSEDRVVVIARGGVIVSKDAQKIIEVTRLFLFGSSEDPACLQQLDLHWGLLHFLTH